MSYTGGGRSAGGAYEGTSSGGTGGSGGMGRSDSGSGNSSSVSQSGSSYSNYTGGGRYAGGAYEGTTGGSGGAGGIGNAISQAIAQQAAGQQSAILQALATNDVTQQAAAQQAAAQQAVAQQAAAQTGLIETNWTNGGIELTDALRGNYGRAVNDPSASWATSSQSLPQQNLAENSSLTMSQSPERNSWDNVETTTTRDHPRDTSWSDGLSTGLGVAGSVVGGPVLGGIGKLVGGIGGSFLDSDWEPPENSWSREDMDGGWLGTGINEQDRALNVREDQEPGYHAGNWGNDTFGSLGGILGGALGDSLLGPVGSIVGNKLGDVAGGWYGDQVYDNVTNSIENGTYGPTDFNAENNYGLGVGGGDGNANVISGGGDGNANVSFSGDNTSTTLGPPEAESPTLFEGDPRYVQKTIPTWLRDLYKDGGDGSEMQNRINPWGNRG